MSESSGQQNRSETAQPGQDAGLGLGGFAMTAVQAAETQDASEIGRRTSRSIGWAIALLVIVAGVVWWFSQGVNQFWRPNLEDEAFLRELTNTAAGRSGIATGFEYQGRLKIRCTIAPSIAGGLTQNDADAKAAVIVQLRGAMKELVLAFSNRRPNETVSVIGYHGDEELAHATFRPTSAAATSDAELEKRIWIHIEGEGMGTGPRDTGGHEH